MKKVIIESHIPFVPDDLGKHFDVLTLAPDDITPSAVSDADALIVRTRTRCDSTLLAGSSVSFIATATIGTDHIDLPWCAAAGITVASAPGCNAPAVAQYVMASILAQGDPRGLTLGVVGIGHVGSIVARWAPQLGMRVLACDPPRAEAEGFDSCTLTDIAAHADIITFHTPHTLTGPHATHHIADAAFFASLRRHPLIINSARGPIVDTPALLDALTSGKVSGCVIDCWEGEPHIDQSLLRSARIATPHIAGYSLNGKIRATAMAVNALCQHFGADYRMTPHAIPAGAAQHITARDVSVSYDPLRDTAALKAAAADIAPAFERLRNHYALRPEVPDQPGLGARS